MVNFLFLVDTSYIMDTKVDEYGLTLLELCKTAIHRSVNNRRKSISKPADTNNNNSKFNHKYLLVTYSQTNAVQCGWENSTDHFLKAIESLQANDSPNFGPALSTAFRLLQSNPTHSHSYAQGWKSWQSEMNVIIILSYCIDNPQSIVPNNPQCTHDSFNPIHSEQMMQDLKDMQTRNIVLSLDKRTCNGDELETDYIQWNRRIFVGNINIFGTLHINHKRQSTDEQKGVQSVRDALNNLCLQTNPTDHNHVINNELHSLAQIERWVTAIMRDNSRDGVMVEFWDSSKESEKFNDGRIFAEFLLPTHCDCKWPIPESYSPKEIAEKKGKNIGRSHNIPVRKCRPQIAISRAQKSAACVPRAEWNVPFEQYELTSPRLRDFVLSLPPNICYYTYIQFSAGTKFNFAKPWGALKADSKRNKAFLYVFVYDFPFIWNQISVFLQAQKRNFHNFSHEEWKRAVAAYLSFIPCYYLQSVKEVLMSTTKGVHMPCVPSLSLPFDPSVTSYLSECARKWRGNSEYKVKSVTDLEMKQREMGLSNDSDSDTQEMCDEFGLECFPSFGSENDMGNHESNELLAIVNDTNKSLEGLSDLMQLPPFIAKDNGNNVRKRNWSKHSNITIDKNNAFSHRRKRRRLFKEKMVVCHSITDSDLELVSAKHNIKTVLSELKVSIFGKNETENETENEQKTEIIRKDSFDLFERKRVESEAQNKLLSHFSSSNHKKHMSEDLNDSFIRNRLSVYGHSDINAWKSNYKILFDQKESDVKHVFQHNIMGNYTNYAEKLRLFSKDEFRNPFHCESEYSNYALSLSFIFLQERISKYRKRKSGQKLGKSFLETETLLKGNELLPIERVLAIKRQTSQAKWTKNEISTRFYDGFEQRPKRRDQHSLLKSPDWLSCQVLHSLKPQNLGGNPFKKRRKKSPFPSVIKPRNINTNTANIINKTNKTDLLLQKQRESQQKFEDEMANIMPHISGLMSDGESERKKETISKPKIAKPKAQKKETKITLPNLSQVSKSKPTLPKKAQISKPIKIKPKPKPKPKVNKRKISKPILPKTHIRKIPMIDTKRAIAIATQRAKHKKQTQILPMKRKNSHSISNSNSHSHSHSHSPSAEPAMKKQKIVTSVSNGNGNSFKKIRIVKDKKKSLKKVSNGNNNGCMNGCVSVSAEINSETQTVNILLFLDEYRVKVRSQRKFDNGWFENGIHCLNGLNYETRHNFYDLLINEAKTYNRYELAQNIHKMSK